MKPTTQRAIYLFTEDILKAIYSGSIIALSLFILVYPSVVICQIHAIYRPLEDAIILSVAPAFIWAFIVITIATKVETHWQDCKERVRRGE